MFYLSCSYALLYPSPFAPPPKLIIPTFFRPLFHLMFHQLPDLSSLTSFPWFTLSNSLCTPWFTLSHSPDSTWWICTLSEDCAVRGFRRFHFSQRGTASAARLPLECLQQLHRTPTWHARACHFGILWWPLWELRGRRISFQCYTNKHKDGIWVFQNWKNKTEFWKLVKNRKRRKSPPKKKWKKRKKNNNLGMEWLTG